MGQLGTMSASELEAMIDGTLDHFGKWAEGDKHELTACLDFLENMCFALSIPIAETAYALYVLRDGILALLYAGAENEISETTKQVNSFFETLVRNLLRRY
jgi:hypothetical protein